jgi:hypothetical protein
MNKLVKTVKITKSFLNQVSIFVGNEFSNNTHYCNIPINKRSIFIVTLNNGYLNVKSVRKRTNGWTCSFEVQIFSILPPSLVYTKNTEDESEDDTDDNFEDEPNIPYDTVNSFSLTSDTHLFLDIFHKNNELILICPVLSNDHSFINKINITSLNRKLEIKRVIKKDKCDQSIIIIYNFDFTTELNNTISVKYNNIVKNYNLFHKLINNENNDICLTTLFKDDYKLINIFHDYYTKQGVDYFFMYYNGIITNKIRKYYKKQNIKLIEWNFMYFNKYCGCDKQQVCALEYYAQSGQIHHALYKYAKNEYKYIIYNDLDEYLNIENYTLKDDIINNDYDIVQFNNCWSEQICKRPYKYLKELPNSFYIDQTISKYKRRSKNMYKANIIDYTGVHCVDYNFCDHDDETKYKISKDNKMFHFYKWSGKTRNFKCDTLYKLLNNSNCINKIPNKTIYFCNKTIDSNMEKYSNNWKILNPEYEIKLYDDEMCRNFLLDNFEKLYCDIFDFLIDGPIKADFWRICILYLYGGVYSDIDNEPLVALNDFIENDVSFVTCSSYWDEKNFNFNPNFIISEKGSIILKNCIDWYIDKYNNKFPYSYWDYSIMRCFTDTICLKHYKKDFGIYYLDDIKIQIIRECKGKTHYDDTNMYNNVIVFNNRCKDWNFVTHRFND